MMTIDEYLKKYQDYYTPQADKEKSTSNANYDKQKETVSTTYNTQVDETKSGYEDIYRENAVRKLVNERKIAENMANLGLTDSGLNRTQQTAVQLSYSNNKVKIDTERQKALDTLSNQLAAEIANIEINKSAAAAEIDSKYAQLAESAAQEAYNTDVEAETARQKALLEAQTEQTKAYYSALSKATSSAQEEAKKASYIIKTNGGLLSRNFTGTLSENGVNCYQNSDGSWTYVDNNSGKKTTLAAGVNPYTGTVNPDVENGAFSSNGYQPNNINGKKLTIFDEKCITVNGNTQSVWKTGGKYYAWDGAKNAYFEVKKSGSDWVVA
ncbi:MAG: hypothetical protein IJ470_03650 [Clostridia bacterium]|nr:hypothetical protein [Clostridia bacterium]